MRITPSFDSKPSISTRSWFNVCSLSSWPPPRPAPLCLPTASISSIKIIHGAFFLPCINRSLTLDAPTPTNISTKSEPDMLKNGTPASPAIAFARRVFPVPGEPTRSTPFGMRPPSLVNFFGSLRKSIISTTSSLASCTPATSLNVTFCWLSVRSLARLLPNAIALPPPTCICRIKNIHTPMSRSIGNHDMSIAHHWD